MCRPNWLTCIHEHWSPKNKDTLSLSPQLKHLLYIDFIFFCKDKAAIMPRHTNIAKTSVSKPLSQGLLYSSNGFTVRDRLNSLSFMAMLQDILFLIWNTKISSLDDCFKKEVVAANKSARSVFSPVNMWYFQINPLGRAKREKKKKTPWRKKTGSKQKFHS